MILSINPDKHIRKAIYDACTLQNIPCFDTRQGQEYNAVYVLMSTQTKSLQKGNKCVYNWDSNITLEVIQRKNKTGNFGSRVTVDDVEEQIISIINNLVINNFVLLNKVYNSNSLTTTGVNENIERKIINLNLKLYEYTN
jgi:hypothetical protein